MNGAGVLLSSELVFSEWERIFTDPMTTRQPSTGWSLTA